MPGAVFERFSLCFSARMVPGLSLCSFRRLPSFPAIFPSCSNTAVPPFLSTPLPSSVSQRSSLVISVVTQKHQTYLHCNWLVRRGKIGRSVSGSVVVVVWYSFVAFSDGFPHPAVVHTRVRVCGAFGQSHLGVCGLGIDTSRSTRLKRLWVGRYNVGLTVFISLIACDLARSWRCTRCPFPGHCSREGGLLQAPCCAPPRPCRSTVKVA